jgi:hypothetical protein
VNGLVARVTRGLIIALAVAVIAAMNVGFWLSYGGLHDFALLGGLRGNEAWAWPASVDLFTLSGELGVTISAITRKADPVSWVLLVVGFIPSMVFNVLHVDVAVSSWAHYAVAAVPPLAGMLALAALLRQVYRLVLAMAGDEDEPMDAETAARESLRATLAAGNPWSRNQLQERFALSRSQAQKVLDDVVPVAASMNGNGPHGA